MVFSKKTKSTKKEFIEYKDGKLISTPVESSKKPIRIEKKDSIPDYQEMAQSKKKEKKQLDLRRYISLKVLKPIFGVLFLLFFAWAIYDLYQSFSEPEVREYKPEEQEVETNKTNMGKEDEDEVVIETTPQKVETVDAEPKVKSNQDELSYALRRASEVNDVIVSTSTKEMTYIQEYLDRLANRMGLENHIERQVIVKEEAHYKFLEDKSFYESPSLMKLYEVSEKRIRLSIEFSKGTKSLLIGGANRSELTEFRNQYLNEDQAIKAEQTEHLLAVLEVNKIAYEYNEETNSLRYTIE